MGVRSMKHISNKQWSVLVALQQFISKNNYPPTVRELAEVVGLKSSSTMHGHLHRLKKQGLIQWEAERPRTLKVIGERHDS